MDLHKLNPWNWFKHEEVGPAGGSQVPVKRPANETAMPSSYLYGSHPILKLHQEFDRLVDEVFRGFGLPSLGSRMQDTPILSSLDWVSESRFHPRVNVSSDNSSYQITLEAPGLKESDVSIEVRGDVLSIQGQKQEETEDRDRHFYHIERSYGAFQRTLALPEDANADEIKASMKDGVLSLTIPRREELDTGVKRISIN